MIMDRYAIIIKKRDLDGAKRLNRDFKNYYNFLVEAYTDYDCISRLSARLSKSHKISPKESTLLDVFMYLIAAEGHICNMLNLLCWHLVGTDHDLYSLTKRKYVKENMEEIRKVEMSTKIHFLKAHGFGMLVKEYDSTFRNDLAHHNYKVDEKGVLLVRGEPVTIDSRLETLTKIADFINEILEETIKKLNIELRKMRSERARL